MLRDFWRFRRRSRPAEPAAGAAASNAARTFLYLSGLFTLAGFLVVYFAQRPSETDHFATTERLAAAELHGRRTVDLQAAKMAHARHNPVYTLGLFGNSRSVRVSAQDLGLDPDQYFNFSVPGLSYRASVLTLERLAAAGKAPATSLISLDNLHLDYSGPPQVPDQIVRLRRLATDVTLGLKEQAPPRQVARAAVRAVRLEAQGVTSAFNADYWRKVLLDQDADDITGAYRLDGSFAPPAEEERARAFPRLTLTQRQILPFYLAADIQRLGELQRRYGVRVVVVESPVHHSVLPIESRRPALLQQFLKACESAGVDCMAAESSAPFVQGVAWPDATHAPGSALGRYIGAALADALGERGSAQR
ncbi:MAG: hypothetical protein RIB45_10500 [Marivibrio sp.]|uniref:hypothetical protein n=1 Tax=Marivibrio sp. TaxID=2039719 RepID=UPI0032EF4DCD